MKSLVKITLVTLALAGGSLIAAGPASAADVTVGVSSGGIAFGYTDGYWDRDHHWHHWRNRHESEEWRTANADHYYAYRHDRDHDRVHAFRDEDRWWDHRG